MWSGRPLHRDNGRYMVSTTKTEVQDVWKQTKEVLLPRAQENEQKFEFVCVNGRTFQVPKGKRVEVPLPVAEVIENAQMQMEQADRESEEMEQAAKSL